MRLLTFEPGPHVSRIGTLTTKGSIVDLNSAYALLLRAQDEQAFYRLADARVPPHMRLLFEGGDRSLEAAAAAFDYALDQGDGATGAAGEPIFYRLDQVKLKAPIQPRKFFHISSNFREHHEKSGKPGSSPRALPWIAFFQNVDAIIGHEEPVIYPGHLTEELDCEIELAVVLKKSGRHFGTGEVVDYIGGYTISNGITARDIQREEMNSGGFSFGKGIDTFCPLGPWIVTADEITNLQNLVIELRVNGEPRQQSHSREMSATIPDILAHYSAMGYSAGDVLSTGTGSGAAAFSSDPKAWYLRPGDVVECEIEGIGVLRNPVVSWEEAYGSRRSS
jgi:2-keto-4-pentenoate hydratase/2-oxohepta-3-ene-1,7-dioic acid hydratase in catechol pathway